MEFGNLRQATEPFSDYKGKVVRYSCNGEVILGVLREVNLKEGYLKFCPSVVGIGDWARIEERNPSLISYPQTGSSWKITPLRDGDLERAVRENNQKAYLAEKTREREVSRQEALRIFRG